MPDKSVKKAKKQRREAAAEVNRLREINNCGLATDVLGSWTGIPADPEEEPVQDVDDL